MEREETISKYIIKLELDVERMIQDFSGYIHTIIENNVGDRLSIEDKEEIMSDVFLTVWHNKEKIDNTKPLKYYMAGITKNLISDKLRKQKKYNNQIEFKDSELVNLEDIDMICEQNQILEVISEELNNMKEKDYKVFAKFYYYSKSIKEIADELGMSESNVGVRLHRIKKKLKKELDKRGFKYKKLLTIILLLFAFTGTVFAVVYVTKLFIKTRKGVDIAKENGYIYEIENKNITESNGIKIKVESILMDNYNLEIDFEIIFEKNEGIEKIKNFEFSDLVIKDEENNLIVAHFTNKEKYKEFCKINGIEASENNNIAIYWGAENYEIIPIKENIYKCKYKTYSDSFPKSKIINVEIGKIDLLTEEYNILQSIEGRWKMKIDLPEKFYQRECIEYKVKDCNIEDIKVTKAEVEKTGMKLELETTLEENIDLEIMLMFPLIENEYVMNLNSEKFIPVISEQATGSYGREENRKIYL